MPTCDICGSEFTPYYPNRKGAKLQRFCGQQCRDKYWRTVYKGRARDKAPPTPKPQKKTSDSGMDIISGIKGLMGHDYLAPSGPVIHYRPGDPGFTELARQYAR